MMPYLRQIMRRLTADKKKLSIMVGLLAVLLLLWGRLLLKEVPRTAVAQPRVAMDASGKRSAILVNDRGIRMVEVELPGTLGRDLFSQDMTGYALLKNKPIVEVVVEKSRPELSDEQIKASLVRQAATGLKLQTTMRGPHPMALINGQLVQVGQTVRGFELVQILPRQVVLRMNGIDIHLEM